MYCFVNEQEDKKYDVRTFL